MAEFRRRSGRRHRHCDLRRTRHERPRRGRRRSSRQRTAIRNSLAGSMSTSCTSSDTQTATASTTTAATPSPFIANVEPDVIARWTGMMTGHPDLRESLDDRRG
jgi:hypothetical protein